MDNDNRVVVYVGRRETLYRELKSFMDQTKCRVEMGYEGRLRDYLQQETTDVLVVDTDFIHPAILRRELSDMQGKRKPKLFVLGCEGFTSKLGSFGEAMRLINMGIHDYVDLRNARPQNLADRVRVLAFKRDNNVSYTEPLTVLGIYSREHARMALETTFQNYGFTLRQADDYSLDVSENEKVLLTAKNKEEAFDILLKNKISVVVMDVLEEETTPEGDVCRYPYGEYFARQMRGLCPKTPVIFFTDYTNVTTFVDIWRGGLAFEYIVKPNFDGFSELLEGEEPLIERAHEHKQEQVTNLLKRGTPHLFVVSGTRYSGKSELSIFAENIVPQLKKQKSLSSRPPRDKIEREYWKDLREKEFVTREHLEQHRKELMVFERPGDVYVVGRDPQETWDALEKGYDVLWVVGDPQLVPELREKFGIFYRGIGISVPMAVLERRIRAGSRGEEDIDSLIRKVEAEKERYRTLKHLLDWEIINEGLRGPGWTIGDFIIPPIGSIELFIRHERLYGC